MVKELKRIPKWGWITGGLAVAVFALWLYERHNSEEDEEGNTVCDPTSPEYDANKCPAATTEPPPGERTYGMGGSMAGGGMQYYYPYPSAQTPAATGEPETPAPPEEEHPAEENGGGNEGGGEVAPAEVGSTGEIVNPIAVGGNSTKHKEPVRGETINGNNATGWCGHPAAVGTGNPCQGGKPVGNAPAGWHLFCCNGMTGRAPDEVAISPGRPAGGGGGGNGSGGGVGASGAAQCAQGTVNNINNARNQISRLQGEIDGLQNHIQQLTNAIQEHPRAQQRGQWEAERNQDRANIDNKRGNISQFQQVIANGQGQPGCAGK